MKRNDITVVDENFETVLLREIIKFILEVLTVLDVFFKTKNCPSLEINWLRDYLSQDVGIVERFSWGTLNTSTFLRTWRPHNNAWTLKNFGLNLIWLQINRKIPLFDLARVSNHFVELCNTGDTVLRLLEKALSNISHDSFVFPNFRRDTYQNAKFWR